MDNAFQTLGPKSMYKLNYNKTTNSSKLQNIETDHDISKNNSMANLQDKKLPFSKFSRNMVRDRTVNPNRNTNKLMGLES